MSFAQDLPTHTRGDMSTAVIERIWRLYARQLWPVHVIANQVGVSERHVHWAIDEARRRGWR